MDVWVVEFHDYGNDGTHSVWSTQEQADQMTHVMNAKSEKARSGYFFNTVQLTVDQEREFHV